MKKIYLTGFIFLYAMGLCSQTWSILGNSGTNPSTNFLGTTDSSPFAFKVNNMAAGYSGHGNNDYANVSFGYLSLTNPNGGGRNTALGIQALTRNSTGWSNIAIGYWALDPNVSGNENIAIGVGSMSQCSSSTSRNVGLGTNALKVNQGTLNTALGTYALNYNTSGSLNTAVGGKALLNNTTGNYNTAIGIQSMFSNTTGEINLGCGSGTLYSNTIGSHNTAVGNSALWSNVSGSQNTAVGDEALAGNLDGSNNVAVGTRALWCGNNDPGFVAWGHGSNNTSTGWESMRVLTSGNGNCAYGYHAMLFTTTGSNNVGLGNGALGTNTTGSGNVALGANSLIGNTSGNYNTAIGYGASVSVENLTNAIAIGNGATSNRSNSTVIGNNSITSIGGTVGWTTLTEDASKKNITQNVPGLSFINSLQPVTYTLSSSPTVYSGFVNQNVQKAATDASFNFSGIDQTNNVVYGLRYSEFVAPMVQSIRELSTQNKEKDQMIASMQSSLDSLRMQVEAIKKTLASLGVDSHPIQSAAYLKQNYPNPVQESTVIEYSLPDTFSSAHIQVCNNNGNILQRIYLTSPNENSIRLNTHSLDANGYYYYSLMVDGKLIDTKKMILK